MELSTSVLRDDVDVEIQFGKVMLTSNVVVFLLFTKNFSSFSITLKESIHLKADIELQIYPR